MIDLPPNILPFFIASDRKTKRAECTPTGIIIHEDCTTEEWEQLGVNLGALGNCRQWWVGDWFLHNGRGKGIGFERAAQIVAMSESSLNRAAWVCSRIPPSERTDRISFSHYAVIAGMSAEDRYSWAGKVMEYAWSTRQLEQSIEEAKTEKEKSKPRLGRPKATPTPRKSTPSDPKVRGSNSVGSESPTPAAPVRTLTLSDSGAEALQYLTAAHNQRNVSQATPERIASSIFIHLHRAALEKDEAQ